MEFSAYINDHPNSVTRIQQKFWEGLTMILKTSPFSIQDKTTRDLDNVSKEPPTLDDLIEKQNIVSKKINSVHRRRDLDSLG